MNQLRIKGGVMYFAKRPNQIRIMSAKNSAKYQVVAFDTKETLKKYLKHTKKYDAQEITKLEASQLSKSAAILILHANGEIWFSGQTYHFGDGEIRRDFDNAI